MRDMGVKAMNNDANHLFNKIYTKIFIACISMMLISNVYISGEYMNPTRMCKVYAVRH